MSRAHWRSYRTAGAGGVVSETRWTPAPDPAAGIIVQDRDGNAITALAVPEGGDASYQVKLASQPEQDVEVCIGLSVRDNNDADITFKGEASDVVAIKLPFTPENWNTAQTVTLVAAEDNDDVNGARDLDHDTRTSDYFPGTVWLAATEIDNDEPAPAAPAGLTATAGDASVALAWNDPADSSITGYEYRTRWAGVAWGDWTAISATTSHTVTGLENGKEYRFKLRAVNAGGASKPGPQSAPWYVVATPQKPPPPPAAPSNVAVDPQDNGDLDITWDAVTGATGYDVRAKAEGASDWHDVASNVTGTSHRYTTDDTMDYVGVRARNANGASAWTDVGRMPPDDLLNIATGLSSDGASAQSVQAQSQLAAPTWGNIKRYIARQPNSAIDVNWTSVNGATGYNIICSFEGWYWYKCGWDDDGTVTYTSVPSGESQPVTVSHYRRTGSVNVSPGDITFDSSRTYMLFIRGVNADPSQASSWVSTPLIRPLFGDLENLTVTRTDGQITLSWTPNYWATGYEIECDTYTAGEDPDYTLCATLSNVNWTDASHGVTITTWTDDGTNYSIDNTSIYDIQITSKNQHGRVGIYVPLIHPNPTLTVSGVGVTTATLTIANHSDAWYYKANAAPHTACQSAVTAGTSSKGLTGLSAGTTYTYTAYSDSACTTANRLATATQFTTLSSVSNLGSTKAGDADINNSLSQAVAFTTGIASTGGYILKTVTIPLKDKGGSNALSVALYEMDDSVNATYTKDSVPKSNAVTGVTFSGTTPTTNSWTDTVWTCSGSGCKLGAGKTYFLAFASSESSPAYAMAYATTENETAQPSGNGWSVGHRHYTSAGSWTTSNPPDWNVAEFGFVHAPTLTVSGVTATGATLTIANHNGDWYYKSPAAGNICQGPVSGTSTTLSGLSLATSYTYSAHSASPCRTTNRLATATAFNTPGVSVSSLGNAKNSQEFVGIINGKATKAAAQFTVGSNSGGYDLSSVTVKIDSSYTIVGTPGALSVAIYSNGNDNKPNASQITLSGSDPTAGEEYTYTCTTTQTNDCTLAKETKYHLVLEAPDAPADSFYAWEASNSSSAVSVPTNNGWSIGESFSHQDDAWGDITPYLKFKVTATANPVLTTSSVTATGATLTIANHDGDWYYKATTGPHNTCQGPVSGTSATLSGLTSGSTYTYTAYSDSGCTTANELATATAFTTP